MIDKFDNFTPSVIGHNAPIHNDPTRYEIVASSKYIQRLLSESLTKSRIEQRGKVISILEVSSSAAAYRGALFEMAMHDQLSAGCTFAARRLGGDITETFACERSGPAQSCYFDSDFSASIISTGPYHIPRARNFAAIDSFHYSTAHPAKPKLWLFQSTVAPSHPVSGEGVLELLERLGLLEIVTAEPDQVALIFVVPEENAPEFGPQKIALKENDKLHVCHVREMLDAIPQYVCGLEFMSLCSWVEGDIVSTKRSRGRTDDLGPEK